MSWFELFVNSVAVVVFLFICGSIGIVYWAFKDMNYPDEQG